MADCYLDANCLKCIRCGTALVSIHTSVNSELWRSAKPTFSDWCPQCKRQVDISDRGERPKSESQELLEFLKRDIQPVLITYIIGEYVTYETLYLARNESVKLSLSLPSVDSSFSIAIEGPYDTLLIVGPRQGRAFRNLYVANSITLSRGVHPLPASYRNSTE